MKHFVLFFAAIAALWSVSANAQIVTTSPVILQENSSDVSLTYHPDSPLGNHAFASAPASTQVYAHIGVITNLSDSWTHVVTPWPEKDGSNADSANTPKNHLSRNADGTYSLAIGDIRSYFGITDPDEHVRRIALVFRNEDGSIQGKTASDGDIFVDVHPEGFAMSFTSDAASQVISEPTAVTFTLNTTVAADLSIEVDGRSIASASAATKLSKSYKFESRGFYTVTAKAVCDGQTHSSEIRISWPGPSVEAPYPGGVPRQGAVRNDDGTVTFCLAAPGKSSVILVPSWLDYNITDECTMSYCDYNGNRYFWTTVSGLADDQWYPYYYLVDGVTPVADPYARLVLDCYSDKWLDPAVWPDMPQYPYDRFDNIMLAIYRGDIDNYKWSEGFVMPDHSQLVVYEMLLRDFTGTVGAANANGTVRQAIDRIPYLKSLGVNAVELMPIMEFNGNNSWGYNTNFYFAPDKAYGSPDDYRDFIDACHQQGIAVILDIVFNQSDGLHPWYMMYPVDSNPFYNAVAPHDYSVLNDWNQGGNPLVEQQWADALTYWLTAYNVDGFRFDLVKGLGDNDSYSSGTDAYNSSRVARMKRLHSVIRSVKPDAVHINEDLAGDREESELAADGMLQWANINRASGRFAAGWNDAEQGISSSLTGGAPVSAFLSTLQGGRPWGSTVAYAESHDEQRLAFYCVNNGKNTSISSNASTRARRLSALAVQMLLTPGPKMIWQFGELGVDQSTKSDDGGNNTDPKVVPWNLLDDSDAMAIHDAYQAIIRLRAANPELFAETATFETSNLDATLVNARSMRLRAGDKEVIALINSSITAQAKTVSAPAGAASYRLLVASQGFNAEPTIADGRISVRLPGGSFAVFISPETQSAVDDILIDPADAPVQYFNLQGIPVANPDGGIYIVRQGNKVSKQYIQR